MREAYSLQPGHPQSVPRGGHSNNYRLVDAGNASVTATSGSPTCQLYLVGGSGVPVGIAASTNFSAVSGGTSNILSTDRIFANGMDP